MYLKKKRKQSNEFNLLFIFQGKLPVNSTKVPFRRLSMSKLLLLFTNCAPFFTGDLQLMVSGTVSENRMSTNYPCSRCLSTSQPDLVTLSKLDI